MYTNRQMSINEQHTTGSAPAINAQSILLMAASHYPAASVAGLGPKRHIVESALRFAGFTVQQHPAGYRLIVMERGRA